MTCDHTFSNNQSCIALKNSHLCLQTFAMYKQTIWKWYVSPISGGGIIKSNGLMDLRTKMMMGGGGTRDKLYLHVTYEGDTNMADFLLPVATTFTPDSTVYKVNPVHMVHKNTSDLNYKNVLSCSSSLFFFYFQ